MLKARNGTSLLMTAVLVVVILAAGAMGAATAVAAETTTQEEQASLQQVAEFQVIQYKVMQWGEYWIARVIAELAEHEHLPAVVEVAVPQHSAVYFFGDGTTNAEFPVPHQVRSEDGLDIYTATLTEGRIALIEYTLPASPFEQTPEGPSIRVTYTPLRSTHELHLIAALPAESAVMDATFEYMGSGPDGEPAFAYIVEDAIGGQEYTTSIVYRTDIGDSSPNANPLIAVGVAVAMLLFAVAVFLFFRKGSQSAEHEE